MVNHSRFLVLPYRTVPNLGSAIVEKDKTNEIPVARQLFERLDLEGRLVSLDALPTQDETARALVLEHGADSLLEPNPLFSFPCLHSLAQPNNFGRPERMAREWRQRNDFQGRSGSPFPPRRARSKHIGRGPCHQNHCSGVPAHWFLGHGALHAFALARGASLAFLFDPIQVPL